METKQVFPSGDIHYYNNEGNLIKAELTGGVIVDYTINPKRVYQKR